MFETLKSPTYGFNRARRGRAAPAILDFRRVSQRGPLARRGPLKFFHSSRQRLILVKITACDYFSVPCYRIH